MGKPGLPSGFFFLIIFIIILAASAIKILREYESMIWFGSSAGVALSSLYPEAKFTGAWLRNGWHVALGYVVGYAVLLALVGWDPLTSE